jgi:hypothetical protein
MLTKTPHGICSEQPQARFTLQNGFHFSTKKEVSLSFLPNRHGMQREQNYTRTQKLCILPLKTDYEAWSLPGRTGAETNPSGKGQGEEERHTHACMQTCTLLARHWLICYLLFKKKNLLPNAFSRQDEWRSAIIWMDRSIGPAGETSHVPRGKSAAPQW